MQSKKTAVQKKREWVFVWDGGGGSRCCSRCRRRRHRCRLLVPPMDCWHWYPYWMELQQVVSKIMVVAVAVAVAVVADLDIVRPLLVGHWWFQEVVVVVEM